MSRRQRGDHHERPLPHLTEQDDDYQQRLEQVVKGPTPTADLYRARIADAKLDGDDRLVRDLERALSTHNRNRLRMVTG